MLETFIVLNEKDREKAKGKVEPIAGGWARKTYLFFKSR